MSKFKPVYLQIHHSASARDKTTPADIEKWHRARGFKGIGYSYIITGDGVVHVGRKEGAVLAACTGHNSDSIAICVTGNFENEELSDEQIDSLFDLISDIIGRYPGIEVKGHRDMPGAATLCPGKNLHVKLENF